MFQAEHDLAAITCVADQSYREICPAREPQHRAIGIANRGRKPDAAWYALSAACPY